jgi:hypothetical protein
MLQMNDLLLRWCAARLLSEQIGTGFDETLIASGLLEEINKRFYAVSDELKVVCKTRHLVDSDDDDCDRYADIGMTGVAKWTAGNSYNPYAVTWANGAYGFYTLEELFVEQTVLLE